MRWKARKRRGLENRAKDNSVILSATNPFAYEGIGGVERLLAARERQKIEDLFIKFHGERAKQIGVLRLRGCFASRSIHSAQDDTVQDDKVLVP